MAQKGKGKGNNQPQPAVNTPVVGSIPGKLGPAYVIRKPLAAQGVTLQQAAAQRASLQLTQQQVASGTWVKVAAVHVACKNANIPISLFVQAFGGDRGFGTGLALPAGVTASSAGTASHFTCMYYGRTRYLPSSALTGGIAQLQAIMQQRLTGS